MDKVSSWEFCNKNIGFTFKIFGIEIFHIYKLKPKGRTRLSLIALFSFGFKDKPPKNLSSKKKIFLLDRSVSKLVYINSVFCIYKNQVVEHRTSQN